MAGGRFTQASGVIATWVGVISAIVGGTLALKSYERQVAADQTIASHSVDERVRYTFDLARHFSEPEFVDFRQRLVDSSDYWGKANFTGSKVKQQEVYALIDYFDVLSRCVDKCLCDGETATALVGPYAAFWYPALATHITEARRADETQTGIKSVYGDGMKRFAGTPANPAICTQSAAPQQRDGLER